MKSCRLLFKLCSLNVNTLTLHKLITSEADGFHSKGVMFLHSPVTGEVKNAMQHTHRYVHTLPTHKPTNMHSCTSAHTYTSTYTFLLAGCTDSSPWILRPWYIMYAKGESQSKKWQWCVHSPERVRVFYLSNNFAVRATSASKEIYLKPQGFALSKLYQHVDSLNHQDSNLSLEDKFLKWISPCNECD